MNVITAQEIAEKWGVSLRYVQALCQKGRIPGAQRKGRDWMIPETATRPADGRKKGGKKVEEVNRPLIRKSPFLDMTDLYQIPGTADACAEALTEHPEAQKLFAAEIAYSRGQIDKVYEYANEFLSNHSGFYAVLSGGMLLALCAIWKGDIAMWHRAKKYLYEAPWKTELDRDIISLSAACVDLNIRKTSDFPNWFYLGRFENLPADAHPAARVFYIRFLMVYAQKIAENRLELDGASGLSLMRLQPVITEPMIAQAVVEKTVIPEIYLRIFCAVIYHQTGDDENAAFHLDKAIQLCLADDLYGPLVEYRLQLGLFLDERLLRVDENATKKVKEMHKKQQEGWTRLHSAIVKETVSSDLSMREREVARLAAFGLSNAQIAGQLHLTESSVKALIKMARNKTGATDRADFGAYI